MRALSGEIESALATSPSSKQAENGANHIRFLLAVEPVRKQLRDRRPDVLLVCMADAKSLERGDQIGVAVWLGRLSRTPAPRLVGGHGCRRRTVPAAIKDYRASVDADARPENRERL